MTYFSEELHAQGFREYRREDAIVFLKTHEAFGGLSNMAGGFPLAVNDVPIRTSEALYQACRFPDQPDVQREIIEQASPMTAKMVGKPHRHSTRRDWDRVRNRIMRWCLRVKLVQNWESFSQLLLSTGDRPIVEQSREDDYWGAKAIDDEVLVGRNVLGRFLMELREDVRQRPQPWGELPAPEIPNFLLLGEKILAVHAPEAKSVHLVAEAAPRPYQTSVSQTELWSESESVDLTPQSSGFEPLNRIRNILD